MDKNLDRLLCETFPHLYKDRFGSPTQTNMCWGFPSDGWFLIIWNLSKELERLIVALPEDKRDSYRASQVKEKFGTLRFDMSAETSEMTKLIDEAELLSAETCEVCGASGKLNETREWVLTLCPKHWDKK